jgi:hypothetical protein
MSAEPTLPELLAALDLVEDQEAALLAWGLTGGSWTEADLEELLGPSPHDPLDLVAGLRRHKLLVELPRSNPPRYRSRVGEGVRLFAALRQLFPQRDWAASPRLVADYRFLVRARRFPVRELGADEVVAQLGGRALGRRAADALRALIAAGPAGGERKLSVFQVEATAAVLGALGQDEDRGVIVTAGTGAGKTLAFYLPAFMRLAETAAEPATTKVLALYPRNELLKDQLLATVREARRLRAAAPDVRPVRIGAYFGSTPLQAADGKLPDWLGWRRRDDGDICPFLPCPECEKPLKWMLADRKAGRERLVCACGTVLGDDLLVLTRKSMHAAPPDILFSTTEMLNRSVMNQWSRHIFGVGPEAAGPPLLVLLDEVHTYEGTAGAQAAYLLRRWRHLVGRPLAWVGLSATLRNADGFFADLTGLRPDNVTEVGPRPEDLAARGREYQLVLRGDPASSTALLSTSIQSLMLLRRILDVRRDDPSGGAFGSKVFAFCDNLDLVNRLYRQQLDAEGFDAIGKRKAEKPLAALRSADFTPDNVTDWPARDADGQQWWVADRIGHPAAGPKVSRTSSQDAGVDEDAQVIVATASLEVGYDDPDVGGVLQHKAPRDVAQFLQRRGRAGRSQAMRPWTVVVLSDYGRDRLAYQSYEQLLEPELPPKSLPVGNRSVQRMQAGFALLDWLTVRLDDLPGKSKGSVRDDLSAPADPDNTWDMQRRQRLAGLLAGLLDDAAERGRFTRWLADSLGLSRSDLEAVCWERPRSLFLDLVPTALRRLESNWQAVRDGEIQAGADRHYRGHPLPEFLPASLFGDLCLPEVHIEPPDGYDTSANTAEAVYLALNDFAPGRVTLRYAVRKVKGLWIDPGGPAADGSGQRRLELSESLTGDADRLGDVPDDDGELLPLLRPYRVRPAVPPAEIKATSNGRWNWRFICSPVFEAIPADLPRGSPWSALVPAARFYLHAGRGGLRVWRYATDGTADVLRNKERERFRYRATHDGAPVAVGFEAVVDAFAVDIDPPSDVAAFALTTDPRRLRSLRRERFAAEVTARLEVESDLTPFLAGWVGEVALAVTARAVVSGGRSVAEVAGMDPAHWAAEADTVLGTIFQSLQPAGDAAPGTFDPDSPNLRARLVETFATDTVAQVVAQALPLLGADPDDGWYRWLRTRFVQTVAAAVHGAVQQLCTSFDAEADLVVDVIDPGHGPATAWLDETSVGGGGIVEALRGGYATDPRRFWTLVLGALEPSDLEGVDPALRRALRAVREDPEVAAAAGAYRKESSPEGMLATWRQLLTLLARRGVAPVHATVVALANRLLRPGTSPATDDVVAAALERWEACEEQLGFSLDHRTACAVLAEDAALRSRLQSAVPGAPPGDDERWGFTTLLGLLWIPAEALRATALAAPSRSWPVPATERTLVLDQLAGATRHVDLDAPDWRVQVDRHLAAAGRCLLGTEGHREQELKAALVTLAVEPVEVGALHVYPRVGALGRVGERVEVELELSEVSQ